MNCRTPAVADQDDGAAPEENAKLKEAVKLMEKNIQRDQREWNLAKSNAKDLEYQKGILSE